MNEYNLTGRRAIVTGGAQGFGYAITKRFIDSGAEVIIWDIDQKAIDKALSELDFKALKEAQSNHDALTAMKIAQKALYKFL